MEWFLHHAQFKFDVVAEQVGSPWWIEGEFYVHGLDAFDVADHLFDFAEHEFGFGTVGCCHGHDNLDVEFVVDVDAVDEFEVVDVDGYFGVIDVFEDIDDGVVQGFFVRLHDFVGVGLEDLEIRRFGD